MAPFLSMDSPPGTSPLSEFDRALFRLLQRDGRAPFTTIAEQLGVSEAHVRRRVRHLIDNDVFSITAVADPSLFGLDSMAWIGLVVAHMHTNDVATHLASLSEVDYVVISSGTFNVMAEVACRTKDDLYDLLLRVRAVPGVQRTETFMYLRLLRQQFQWAHPDDNLEPDGHLIVGAAPRTELDAVDLAVIRELQQDGRVSIRDIAARLSISERTASSRYTRLSEHGPMRVMAVGNPITLGFTAMAWLGINLRDGASLEGASRALSVVPQVSYLVAPSGRYDLMAEVVCRDRDHLLETLSQRIGETASVGHIETFYYLRLLYRTTAGAWGAARTLEGKMSRRAHGSNSGNTAISIEEP